jgi:hypothetical protein
MTCRRCAQVLAEPQATVEAVAQHEIVAKQAAEALADDRPIPLAVAQHEICHVVAAHVVAAHVVGGQALLEVIARPDSGSTWHVSPFEGDPAGTRDRVLRAIAYTLAGGIADERNGLGWPCSRRDVLLADRFIALIGHDLGHDTALAPLRFMAAEIVRDAWQGLIQPLAIVLQAQRRLAGPGVMAFLEKNAQAQELRWFYSRAFTKQGQVAAEPGAAA